MEDHLEIGGVSYELVAKQRGGSAVYRSNGGFLRIGPREVIGRHLRFHRAMEQGGYPVPKLLAEGEHEGRPYFLEETLPGARLNDLFAEDHETVGGITEEHFEAFASVTLALLEAQARGTAPAADAPPFSAGIRLETLAKELPEHAERIRARFAEAERALAAFPLVLSHGDLNPANMFAGGIIDLEDAFLAPIGYDIVSAIITTDWFPPSREYEYFRKYRFSEEQARSLYARADALLGAHGLPPLSAHLGDFTFCRAVWMTVELAAWPKLQAYRYERIVNEPLA